MGPGTRCLPIRQRNQAGVRSLREVSKCHLPIWGEGQDEAIYKPVVYSSKQWKVCGVSSVRKKTEGSGEMVSATTGELRGFGFPMTPEEVMHMGVNRTERTCESYRYTYF